VRQLPDPGSDLERLLEPDEAVHHKAEAVEAVVAVTDRRVLIRDGNRIALDVAFGGIRRIQLDVERGRESTFVIVPEQSRHTPQVLTVPDDQLHQVSTIVAAIGLRLDRGRP